MLAVLACSLPIAARAITGPRGAIVHVRWQQSLEPAAREALESTFHLSKAERLEGSTWRYELTDPSSGNLQSLVQHPASEDTQGIDRRRYTLSSSASRTDRRQWLTITGNTVVFVADRMAILVTACAALLIWLGASSRAYTLQAARSFIATRTTALIAGKRMAPVVRWLTRGIPDVDANTAGIFRILFGVLVVSFFTSRPEDTSSLTATFNPIIEGDLHVAVVEWLRARPSIPDSLAPWLLWTGIAFTIGLYTRFTYTLFVAGAVVWAFVAVVHDSTHPNSTLVLTLIALLPSRWGDALSVDSWRCSRNGGASPATRSAKHYGYSVWVPGLVFGVAFAAAAWAKVVGTGPRWILNGSVKYHFITDSPNAPFDWGLQLAGHPYLAVLASLATVVVEALVITAAFSRNEWYRLAIGALAFGMLAGFALFMGVIWPGWWVLLLGFLPWARMVSRFRRHPVPPDGVRSTQLGQLLQPSVGQLIAIVLVLGQQVLVSSMRVERAPMFTYYPMYSSTYISPEQFNAAVTPYYRIVLSTPRGRVELSCNAPNALVAAMHAALHGSSEAVVRVWRDVRACRSQIEDATSVTFEGDRRTFDWEQLRFRMDRAAIVLGPLQAP
jgi:hypothetical protein